MDDDSLVNVPTFGGRRSLTGDEPVVPVDVPAIPAPSKHYGTLADAVRECDAEEGNATFTVRNEDDRHELWRLLSGKKRRRSVEIDPNQKERVSWKANEAE